MLYQGAVLSLYDHRLCSRVLALQADAQLLSGNDAHVLLCCSSSF